MKIKQKLLREVKTKRKNNTMKDVCRYTKRFEINYHTIIHNHKK